MAIDYAALKSEINTDPLTLGYAAFVSAGNDQGIATILNLRSGAGSASVFRNDVLPAAVGEE